MDNGTYPNINMEETGLLLKRRITEQGYTVKDIQKYLQLSCPQPVYRWFKGRVLPSLDHLLMLSRMLKVHMEELLVVEEDIYGQNAEQGSYGIFPCDIQKENEHMEGQREFLEDMKGRMLAYWKMFCVRAA